MKSLINKFLKHRALTTFQKNCVFGERFSCGIKARCFNESNKEKITLGSNNQICGTLIVTGKGKITIGNNVTVRPHSQISSSNSIQIGNEVIISNNVTIMDNNSHPISPAFRRRMSLEGPEGKLWSASYAESSPIIIHDNVWICERSVILKGVEIGEGSIVACDSIVTHNVPPYVIVAGNPAKVVKEIKKDEEDSVC